MRTIVTVIAITLFLFPATCTGSNATDSLKVGVVLPLTGEYAQIAKIQRNSMLLAVDEINLAGGVKGRPVTVIIEDDNSQPDLARAAAEKMIEKDRVLHLTGACRSEAGWSIAAIAEQRRIPFLITSGAVDEITEQNWKYVFRLAPPLSQYLEPLLSFLAKVVHPRRLAIVYENSMYGTKSADLLAQAFQKTGGEVVAREVYEMGVTDFRPILTRVKNAQPDVVFMSSSAIEGALLMRQSQELNLTPKVFVGGALGFTLMQFTLEAGLASDDVFSIDLWSPRLPYVGARKYFYDYVFRYLSSTNYHGAQAYACMQVIADALKRAKSLTPDGVRQALAETDMQTAFGPVSFESKGKKTQQNYAPTFLGQWQGGTLEIVWPTEFASAHYIYPVSQWQEEPEKDEGLFFSFSLH